MSQKFKWIEESVSAATIHSVDNWKTILKSLYKYKHAQLHDIISRKLAFNGQYENGRMGSVLFHIKGDLVSSSWKHHEARRVKISQARKKLSPEEKIKNGRVGIIKWCFCPTKKWKAGNYNSKERNFVRKCIIRGAQANQWCRERIQWWAWKWQRNFTVIQWRS